MSLNPITYTAAKIATYVKRQFGDESGVQITDADIYMWIDSAQLEIVSRVAPLKAKGTTDIVAGQANYDLSGLNIHQIESIHYSGGRLANMSFQEAERTIINDGSTFEDPGTPVFWYEWAGQFTLWPVPDTDLVGGLTIYYTKMPTKVVAGTDLLSVPDKYFEAIACWVLSKAYELDEEFQAAQAQRNYFENRLLEQNGEELEAMNVVYPTITFIGD